MKTYSSAILTSCCFMQLSTNISIYLRVIPSILSLVHIILGLFHYANSLVQQEVYLSIAFSCCFRCLPSHICHIWLKPPTRKNIYRSIQEVLLNPEFRKQHQIKMAAHGMSSKQRSTPYLELFWSSSKKMEFPMSLSCSAPQRWLK